MSDSKFHKLLAFLGLVEENLSDIPGAAPTRGFDEPTPVDEWTRQPAPIATPRQPVPPARRPSLNFIDKDGRVLEPKAAVPPTSINRGVQFVNSELDIEVVIPREFNDATTFGDQLKQGRPVIVNLHQVDDDLRRRLLDFVAGALYVLGAAIQPLSARKVYLLTPAGVTVSPEVVARLKLTAYDRA